MVDLSIILPCYNSEADIESRVLEFEQVLKPSGLSWELLLCDDGSSDRTPEICRRLAQPALRRHFFPRTINRGRGRTVVEGIRRASGRYVGFADIDASISAAVILPVIRLLESGYDLAVAHRRYIVKRIVPSALTRWLAHGVYAKLVERFLDIRGHDTASGFKFFRQKSAAAMIKICQAEGWFWNTEVMTRAHLLSLQIAEVPWSFKLDAGMIRTNRLIPESVHQFRQLRALARELKGRSLRGPCCGLKWES